MKPVWPEFKFGPVNLWTMPASRVQPKLKVEGVYFCKNKFTENCKFIDKS